MDFVRTTDARGLEFFSGYMMEMGTRRARNKRETGTGFLLVPHTQGYWSSIWARPVSKWRAALLGRKIRPLLGAKHISIDKGNALVCLGEIAVRGGPPSQRNRVLVSFRAAAEWSLSRNTSNLGQKRVLRASDICSCASCIRPSPCSCNKAKRRQAVRRRGPGKHRCYRVCVPRRQGPALTPERLSPRNQPAVHPGKSQRRAAGDASDWLEPQLHVCRRNAIADLYPLAGARA